MRSRVCSARVCVWVCVCVWAAVPAARVCVTPRQLQKQVCLHFPEPDHGTYSELFETVWSAEGPEGVVTRGFVFQFRIRINYMCRNFP